MRNAATGSTARGGYTTYDIGPGEDTSLPSIEAIFGPSTAPDLHDDPIGRDADDLPMPEPAEIELPALYDVFANSFAFKPADQ